MGFVSLAFGFCPHDLYYPMIPDCGQKDRKNKQFEFPSIISHKSCLWVARVSETEFVGIGRNGRFHLPTPASTYLLSTIPWTRGAYWWEKRGRLEKRRYKYWYVQSRWLAVSDRFFTYFLRPGSITTADGSSLVKWGETTIICGVKAEIAEPDLDRPLDGWIGMEHLLSKKIC